MKKTCTARPWTVSSSAMMGLLMSALTLPATVMGADLNEIYQRALRNDPQLREAENNYQAALEAKPQAVADLLPQVTGTAGYVHDNNDTQSPYLSGTGTSATFSTIRQISSSNTQQWGLSLRQTILDFDKLIKVKQTDAQIAQATVNVHAAQQDMILRAATAYFNVVDADDALNFSKASQEAILRQLEQAQKRFEVGLIAVTDVEDARAAADQATASVIAAKRALADARDRLREITGSDATALAEAGDDLPLVTPDPVNEDAWVKSAMEQNFALLSARYATDIARDQINRSRSGFAPTLSFVASRTSNDSTGNILYQGFGGELPNNGQVFDNQIGIQFTIPLYNGGADTSRVKESVYRHRAAQEHLEYTARATERAARDAYRGVVSSISQVKAYKQAVSSSKVALEATEAGYDVGTRTAVDVLLSRQRYFDALSNYSKARSTYILNTLTLKQITGSLTPEAIHQVNGWLSKITTIQ